MTSGIAWVGRRKDGREHLYIAADSRTRGAYTFDSCPKILTLPRSDCALCFAGDTSDTYPLMVQMAYAIAAHEPSRDRSMDIARVKAHLLRLFTDLVRSLKTPAVPFKSDDAQFLFAGYSWLKKEFRIWTIQYLEKEKKFSAREALAIWRKANDRGGSLGRHRRAGGCPRSPEEWQPASKTADIDRFVGSRIREA